MSVEFDPHYKWLAIPPAEQPPNFYRLLSLPLYESDQEVIAAAAVQRINWVRNFESGADGEIAKQIKGELSAAWMCLRDAEQKEQYDEQLRRQLAPAPVEHPQAPSTLFTEAMSHPAPRDRFADVPVQTQTAQPKRRNSSSLLGILLQASAGPLGLVLGYIILCQFGPQYDFLGIWYAAPSKATAGTTSKPSNDSGSPHQHASLKPVSQKAPQLTTETRLKPVVSTPLPPAANSPKIDEASPELSPRSPVAEPTTPPTNSLGETPEKSNAEPSPSAVDAGTVVEAPPKSEPGKIQVASIAELQKAIAKCRNAKEVLQLLSAALDNSKLFEDTKIYARAQVPSWEARAANDSVRFGDAWMPRSDAKAAREKANDLIIHAADLLSVSNDQPALERLQEAARLDPEATSATFLLGVHYALGLKNYQEAKVHFNNCLRRRPDDPGALNNLALAQVMLGKNAEGLKTFRAAVESNPRSPEIAHNIRKILKQDSLKILVLPPVIRKGFADLLTSTINDGTVTALDDYGWLYVLPAPAAAFEGLPSEVPHALLRFAQSKTDKTVKVHTLWIEDCQCLWCLGAGKVPCPNPDCAKGKVIVVTGREPTGVVDKITLQPFYRNKTETKDCTICKGKGYLVCDKCTGRGIDPTADALKADVSKQ